jgi:CBS domain-containing protein
MQWTHNLRVDSVSRLNPTAPRELDAAATVGEAVERMRAERVGCLLVVRGGRLVGIFTERDLLARVLAVGRPLTDPVAAVMTPDPVTVSPKDSIRTAVKRMQAGGYRHLPVTDEDARPVGILSVKRVVHYLVEHFPHTVYNQPPDPNQVPGEAEGA